MIQSREEAMQEAYTTIRRQVLEEVTEVMYAKHEAITKLLENGRPLLEQATGDRFESIYNQRMKLWTKLEHINQAISIVIDMR